MMLTRSLPVFTLAWRSSPAGLFPVITRKLARAVASIATHGYADHWQHPPVGMFEQLCQGCETAAALDAPLRCANAWAWIAGRDDSAPNGDDTFHRTSEWCGYPADFARLIYPRPPHSGPLCIEPRKVLLREQTASLGTAIGWSSFALSDGHCVEVVALADGTGCFVCDDPELVLADSAGELFQITAMLSTE